MNAVDENGVDTTGFGRGAWEAQLLPRLVYWFRRTLPDLFQPARRSVEYETHLSIDPEAGLEILDGASYSFPLPFAGQIFRAQAAPADPGAESGSQHARGLRLGLIVEAESTAQAWLLRFPFVRARMHERLRNLAARILFYACSGEHRDYAFSSQEYATGRWLRELYPALNPNSFPESGWLPARWQTRTIAPLRLLRPAQSRRHPQSAGHAAFAERLRTPLRRRRRILLIPLRALRSEVERLLPPPFEARWRNSPETPGARAEMRLYLRVWLDGGGLESVAPGKHSTGAAPRREIQRIDQAADFAAPPPPPELSEYDARSQIGDEDFLYLEVLCPALLHADPIRARGWVPLAAHRFPLHRPVLPWDEFSYSYRVRSDGLRFCIGDGRRRMLGASFWRPVRGLHAGEYPPRLLRSRPANIFLQSPESLDVHLFRESCTAPANRIYLLNPAQESSADLPEFLGRRLGIDLRPEAPAWFASYADVATLSEQIVALDECHYRKPRPGILGASAGLSRL